MKSSQPRELALRILTQVLSEQRSLDEVPEWTLTSLPAESRGWLQEVVLGTLRWKGRLDLVIDSIALKKKPSGWLRKVLLVGAYQLIAQDRVPSAWVVSESVDLIKKREGEAPARFANALLRRVSDHAAEWRDMKGDTAEWASLPRWFWDRLVRDHGLEWSRAFAQAALQRPRIWVRARENALPSFSGLSSWASPGPLPESWEVR